MANEITISMSMSASKGGASVNTVGATGPASASYDMTGADMISGTQILASTGTTYALNLGSVTAPYRAYIMNMGASSTTGIVTIDRATPVSATPAITLGVGDECFIVVQSGTTIYLTSDTNATTVYVAIVEK
jgi:hypothetical protein